MIKLDQVNTIVKKKDLRGTKVQILHNISLHIQAKQIFAIIGPNGAGKSTLLKNLLGFTQPTTGRITISPTAKIGFLPENPYYYDYLTLKELLWFSARTFGLNKTSFNKKVEQIATLVGMENHLPTRLREFSKGMTQRAGIAAAIIHDPDLLIFDEPMSGLDPLGRKMVFELIKDLKDKGKTILFCSHILSDVERLCDSVAIMHEGRVKKLLSREDLLLAQKATEILLESNQQAVELLYESNYHYTVTDSYISVFVDASELNQTLQFFTASKIKIMNIKASEATLENIFYQLTSGEA